MTLLRKLELKDVPYMMEWMHDGDTAKYFIKDMAEMTISEVEDFCGKASSGAMNNSLHFAITNMDDEYMGTISLKDIDRINGHAEYAISMRQLARGTGMAKEATGLLLDKGFNELGLHRIYLSVLETNQRAIRFYEKCGFALEGISRDAVKKNDNYYNLRWYSILKEEYIKGWR